MATGNPDWEEMKARGGDDASDLTPIKKVAKKIIIACAAGGRGDPCTQ